MVIRQEQIAELEDDVQRRFRARVAVYLRTHLPGPTESWSEEELSARIARWQQRAAVHGVRGERGIAKWSYLSIVLTETFDEQTAIRDYLGQPTPPPDQKVDMLMRVLEQRMRMAEAQQR